MASIVLIDLNEFEKINSLVSIHHHYKKIDGEGHLFVQYVDGGSECGVYMVKDKCRIYLGDGVIDHEANQINISLFEANNR